MVSTILLTCLSICAVACAIYYQKKWNKAHREKILCDVEISHANLDILALTKDVKMLRKDNQGLKNLLKDLKSLLDSKRMCFRVDEGISDISVIGYNDKDPILCFVLKSFPFNPEDEADHEFAIREAEELIEKLES